MAPTTTASGAADPGLSFRVDSIDRLLAALVADLEPDRVLGAEAASLYGAFARLERLVVAAKTLLAPPRSPPRATGSPRVTAARPASSPPWKGSPRVRRVGPWRPDNGSKHYRRPRRPSGRAHSRVRR